MPNPETEVGMAPSASVEQAEPSHQPWVPKALAEIDAALTEYATRRDQMNLDGLVDERKAVVDQMLDRRLRFTRHLETGEPLS